MGLPSIPDIPTRWKSAASDEKTAIGFTVTFKQRLTAFRAYPHRRLHLLDMGLAGFTARTCGKLIETLRHILKPIGFENGPPFPEVAPKSFDEASTLADMVFLGILGHLFELAPLAEDDIRAEHALRKLEICRYSLHMRPILHDRVVEALFRIPIQTRSPLALVGASEDPSGIVLRFEHEDTLVANHQHIDLGGPILPFDSGYQKVLIGFVDVHKQGVVESVLDDVLESGTLIIGHTKHADRAGHLAFDNIDHTIEQVTAANHIWSPSSNGIDSVLHTVAATTLQT